MQRDGTGGQPASVAQPRSSLSKNNHLLHVKFHVNKHHDTLLAKRLAQIDAEERKLHVAHHQRRRDLVSFLHECQQSTGYMTEMSPQLNEECNDGVHTKPTDIKVPPFDDEEALCDQDQNSFCYPSVRTLEYVAAAFEKPPSFRRVSDATHRSNDSTNASLPCSSSFQTYRRQSLPSYPMYRGELTLSLALDDIQPDDIPSSSSENTTIERLYLSPTDVKFASKSSMLSDYHPSIYCSPLKASNVLAQQKRGLVVSKACAVQSSAITVPQPLPPPSPLFESHRQKSPSLSHISSSSSSASSSTSPSKSTSASTSGTASRCNSGNVSSRPVPLFEPPTRVGGVTPRPTLKRPQFNNMSSLHRFSLPFTTTNTLSNLDWFTSTLNFDELNEATQSTERMAETKIDDVVDTTIKSARRKTPKQCKNLVTPVEVFQSRSLNSLFGSAPLELSVDTNSLTSGSKTSRTMSQQRRLAQQITQQPPQNFPLQINMSRSSIRKKRLEITEQNREMQTTRFSNNLKQIQHKLDMKVKQFAEKSQQLF